METLYKHQIEFISYLQRLFQEGDFNATYKFAFLHAIADISIEKEIPDNGKLQISFDEIVEKFILLYWQHAKPFITDCSQDKSNGILLQNDGNQAQIITNIIKLQELGANNLNQAKSISLWPKVFRDTMNTFKKGPLWRLQILLNNEECYLFPHIKNRPYIELNIGIAQCFRQFHDLVVRLSRQEWINKISTISKNQQVIGRAGELQDFLFGTSRSSLASAAVLLRDIQKGDCFYCKKPIEGAGEVDHFIPFTKYNNDLGHNFVLAHKSCNNNKRDYLAAPQHRDNWHEQNLVLNEEAITNELAKYFTCDSQRSEHVANWAYNIAEANGSKYWLAARDVFV